MPLPSDRQDAPPQPADKLPELSQAEQMYLHRLGRLAKAGLVRQFTVRHHDKKDALNADWTEAGGGRLLK